MAKLRTTKEERSTRLDAADGAVLVAARWDNIEALAAALRDRAEAWRQWADLQPVGSIRDGALEAGVRDEQDASYLEAGGR